MVDFKNLVKLDSGLIEDNSDVTDIVMKKQDSGYMRDHLP